MAGITVDTEGLAITNSLDGHPIFAWSTWFVQVMPLFFVMGEISSVRGLIGLPNAVLADGWFGV